MTVGDSGDRDTFLWRCDPFCALVLSFNAFLFRVSCSCSGAVAVAAREVHATCVCVCVCVCVCLKSECVWICPVLVLSWCRDSRGAVSLGIMRF